MELRVPIKSIAKLKTTTELREEKDKDGEVVDRRLVTKIQFEAEIDPEVLAEVHRLLASETPVDVLIGSPQALMEIEKKEAAFARA